MHSSLSNISLGPLLCALLVLTSGCALTKSRYAMDDPVYAEKYEQGAPRGDLLGKAKQALDARHTDGLSGRYLSGGAQVRPDSGDAMGGVELGAERYSTSWMTARGALSYFSASGETFGGLDLGLRWQAPSRIAPFVGIGTFNGWSSHDVWAADDGIDNDDDLFIDEPGEQKSTLDGWLSSVYPELGSHLWLNGRWRVTAFGRYLVTTEGRDHDDWLLGLQLACFGR